MLQDAMMSVTISLRDLADPQQRLGMLQHESLVPTLVDLAGDSLTISGCKALVNQVRTSPINILY